jgi:hypothetical protein
VKLAGVDPELADHAHHDLGEQARSIGLEEPLQGATDRSSLSAPTSSDAKPNRRGSYGAAHSPMA